MHRLNVEQLQYESDTWKRVLSFMSEENIRLKHRLSEVLRNKFDPRLLVKAEIFQNNFIREDDLIALLQNDIADFDRVLVRELFEDGVIVADVKRRVKGIRAHINTVEKGFNKLKFEFNNYLTEYILG